MDKFKNTALSRYKTTLIYDINIMNGVNTAAKEMSWNCIFIFPTYLGSLNFPAPFLWMGLINYLIDNEIAVDELHEVLEAAALYPKGSYT